MYGSHHTIVRTLAIAVAPRIPAIPKGLANTTDNRILRIALITIAFLRSLKRPIVSQNIHVGSNACVT